MIYIITHKKFKQPLKSMDFSVLQVGASANAGLGYLRDDINENISDLNPYFCELTGMYWIWKNVREKFVGICHYRRYFFHKGVIAEERHLNKMLDGYDVIAPKLDKFAVSVYKQYGYSDVHNISDLDCLINIVKSKYCEYVPALEKVMKEKSFYPFNMMYMKKELFDQYCIWLFDILFELKKKIPYQTYIGQKKRVFGYLAERMFLVWIRKNRLRVREINVYNTEGEINIREKIFTRINSYSTLYLKMDFRRKNKEDRN